MKAVMPAAMRAIAPNLRLFGRFILVFLLPFCFRGHEGSGYIIQRVVRIVRSTKLSIGLEQLVRMRRVLRGVSPEPFLQ
jgi:hypothetical protein